MDCDKVGQYIDLYLDNDLSSEQTLFMLEHIEECPKCKNLYRDLKVITSSLKIDNIPYPEDLHEKILGYIEENKDTQIVQYRPKTMKFFYGSLAACALVAVVATFSEFQGSITNEIEYAQAPKVTMTTGGMPETDMITMDEGAANYAVMDESEAAAMPTQSAEPRTATEDGKQTYEAPIIFSDYAFVFEFAGSEEITEKLGEVVHSEGSISYIKIENKITTIESVVTTLEKLGYIELEYSTEYDVSRDLEYGIIIIHNEK